MNGLMLHCGAKAINKAELATLPLAAPMGPRHAIRPFAEDVEIVTDRLTALGLPIAQEAYGVTKDADGTPKQFFGLIEVEDGDDRGHGVMVGLRGSYDQTLPRGLAIGSRVFVCDNLAFSGQVTFKTKQTLDIDARIRAMLETAVNQVPAMSAAQDKRFESYRHIEVGQTVGNSMLTDLVRKGVINASQIGVALQEWDSPRHAEHAEDGWSLWRLHNAVTESLKPSNADTNAVQRNWGRTIGLTEYLDEAVRVH
jgi:hypothetical protein